jgi:hypothetical protein
MRSHTEPDKTTSTRRSFLMRSGSWTAGLSLAFSVLRPSNVAAAISGDPQEGAASATPPEPKETAGKKLIDAPMRDQLLALLTEIADWIMARNLGDHELKGISPKDNRFIWINGNLARVLMAGQKIFGNEKYLAESLRWCDYLVDQQQPVITADGREAGYWADRGATGNIYLADAGTASTALALAYKRADESRKKRYLQALEKFSRFVRFGCREDPQGEGRGTTPSWLIQTGKDRGALGCGYYRGHLSTAAYVISTAVNAVEFHSLLYSINKDPEVEAMVVGAVRWILGQRQPDGQIPYIIDGLPPDFKLPLTTLTYCGEGLMAAHIHLHNPELRRRIATEVKSCVEWLLKTQNDDGSWGRWGSFDQQRSPGVVNLLAWYYRTVAPDPRVARAIRKYCRFLLHPANREPYGVKRLVRTTSFVGMVAAELIEPGAAFASRKGLSQFSCQRKWDYPPTAISP